MEREFYYFILPSSCEWLNLDSKSVNYVRWMICATDIMLLIKKENIFILDLHRSFFFNAGLHFGETNSYEGV